MEAEGGEAGGAWAPQGLRSIGGGPKEEGVHRRRYAHRERGASVPGAGAGCQRWMPVAGAGAGWDAYGGGVLGCRPVQ